VLGANCARRPTPAPSRRSSTRPLKSAAVSPAGRGRSPRVEVAPENERSWSACAFSDEERGAASGPRWFARSGSSAASLDLAPSRARPRWNAGRARGATRNAARRADHREARAPAPQVRRPGDEGAGPGWGARGGAQRRPLAPGRRPVAAGGTRTTRAADPPVPPARRAARLRASARCPRVVAALGAAAPPGAGGPPSPAQAVRMRSRVVRLVRSSSSTPPVTARCMFRAARPAPRTVCSWWT